MSYLVIDCETTTFQKGHPYARRNKLCLVGLYNGIQYRTFDIEYSNNNYLGNLQQIQRQIDEAKILILFNAKFDLAWLHRYGIKFSHRRIWDCQLVDFILSGQENTYPSLNKVSEAYGLGIKLTNVKEEYWNNGLDTTDIPLDLLEEYLVQDLKLTGEIYLRQYQEQKEHSLEMMKLISLATQDLLVLLEMETNGIMLDFQGMTTASIITNEQINKIKEELNGYFTGVPTHCLNYNSGDCLSALLYGGTVQEQVRKVIGVYKTGHKSGLDRYRVSYVDHVLPRRFEPPRGSQLKKEGFFATNEGTLRRIQAKKEDRLILDKLLLLSKLEKLNNTYYVGLQELHKEKDWEDNIIHGQFNQVVAHTGRLSSSSPNLQNFPPEIDKFIQTRF